MGLVDTGIDDDTDNDEDDDGADLEEREQVLELGVAADGNDVDRDEEGQEDEREGPTREDIVRDPEFEQVNLKNEKI